MTWSPRLVGGAAAFLFVGERGVLCLLQGPPLASANLRDPPGAGSRLSSHLCADQEPDMTTLNLNRVARQLARGADLLPIDEEWRDFPLPAAELRRLTRQMNASTRCRLQPALRVPDWGPNFYDDEDRGRTKPTSDEQQVGGSLVPDGRVCNLMVFGGSL